MIFFKYQEAKIKDRIRNLRSYNTTFFIEMEQKQLQWFHHVKITDSESERKDCGKIKNFLSINPYKMEMLLQEEEDKLKRNV